MLCRDKAHCGRSVTGFEFDIDIDTDSKEIPSAPGISLSLTGILNCDWQSVWHSFLAIWRLCSSGLGSFLKALNMSTCGCCHLRCLASHNVSFMELRSDAQAFLCACVSVCYHDNSRILHQRVVISLILPARYSNNQTNKEAQLQSDWPSKRMDGCRSGRYKKRQGSILPSHPMLQSPERPRMIGGIRRQNAVLRLCPLSSTPWRLPHVGRGARSLL